MNLKQLQALEDVIREHEVTHSDGKWAIGDKLLEICNEPSNYTTRDGSHKAIAECAEYLTKREFENSYNLGYLIQLREIAHNFDHHARVHDVSWAAHSRAHSPERMERIVELAKKKGVKVTVAFVDEYLAKIKADLEAEARKEKEKAEREAEEARKRAEKAQNDKDRERAEKEREEAEQRAKDAAGREKKNKARPKPKPKPKPAADLELSKIFSEISSLLEVAQKRSNSYLPKADLDWVASAERELVEIFNQTKALLDQYRKVSPRSSNLRVVK